MDLGDWQTRHIDELRASSDAGAQAYLELTAENEALRSALATAVVKYVALAKSTISCTS